MLVRRFLGFLGAAGALVVLFAACGGKVVVDAPSGSGAGGSGGASSFTTADGAPNPTEVTVSGVTTGSGVSCDPTYSCLAAISLGSLEPEKLCPGTTSATLYNALQTCACVDACSSECGSTACMGVEGSPICKQCVADPAMGCADELNACLADP
jgi:hypothetical protein